MDIQTFDKDMHIISALPDEPNDVGGITAESLKAKFDEAGIAIQDFLNTVLIPTLNDWQISGGGGGHVIEDKNGEQMTQRTRIQFLGTVSDDGTRTVVGFTPADIGVANYVFPVGSLYLAMNHTSPAVLFGGTWTRIEDKFLLGAASSDAVGATGGESEHTLTVDEMPSHTHSAWTTSSSGGTYRGVLHDYTNDEGAGAAYKAMNNIRYTGGGAAHNNMPPYIRVSIWQRIA